MREKIFRSRKLLLWFVLLIAVVCAAAVTQIDLTTQVKGVLPAANGGTGQNSTATFPTTGTIASSSVTLTSGQLLVGAGAGLIGVGNLSGDVTTSGSTAAVVARINGTTVPTNSAADQALITNASATGTWATLPNGIVQYSTASHTFSAATVLTGTFADNETPTGTINGVNSAFTLAFTPSPTASLCVFKNGQLMNAGGNDYTLSTNTITFVSGAIPKTGDVLLAHYRH